MTVQLMHILRLKYKRQSERFELMADFSQVIATDLSPIQPTWYVD
jgi:hypothetical protein